LSQQRVTEIPPEKMGYVLQNYALTYLLIRVPTPNLDVRPYSTMIDAGVFTKDLMKKGTRLNQVCYFHGHSHCKNLVSIVEEENGEPDKGKKTFISLGTKGFFTENPSFSCAEIYCAEEEHELLAVHVLVYELNGASYSPVGEAWIHPPQPIEHSVFYSEETQNIERAVEGLFPLTQKKYLYSELEQKLLGENSGLNRSKIHDVLLKMYVMKKIDIRDLSEDIQKWKIVIK